MNLASTVSLYAGGPGSGCNPEKGKCGRPAKDDSQMAKKSAGLSWAKTQIPILKKKGWKRKDIEHHVLAELGRNFNIGVQMHVQRVLRLKFQDFFGPEPEELEDDE